MKPVTVAGRKDADSSESYNAEGVRGGVGVKGKQNNTNGRWFLQQLLGVAIDDSTSVAYLLSPLSPLGRHNSYTCALYTTYTHTLIHSYTSLLHPRVY